MKRLARRVWPPIARLAQAVLALPIWVVLCALVACQWIALGILAAISTHNGAVYFHGGDDTWYYTSAWVLGQGHVPFASVGYGYPILLAPLAHFAGPNLVHALPLVIGFNVLVLSPIVVLCIYGIAKMIGGRGFAYLASFLWAALPLLAIPYFPERYYSRYIDATLPAALGLTALADFPSQVFVLVGAYFALKAVLERGSREALYAGLAGGFAVAVKPSNAIFLPAFFATLLFARHWRGFVLVGLGLMPALAALGLWKYRGLGYLPAFGSPPTANASGAFPAVPLGGLGIRHYLSLNWDQWRNNFYALREFFWSQRLVIWVIFAGALGLARRSGAAVVLLTVWLGAFLVLKGSSDVVSVNAGNYFRYMTPAFPAYFLLLVSVPLAVPLVGGRLAAAGRVTRSWPRRPRDWKVLLGVAGALAVVPIAAFLIFPPLTTTTATRVANNDQYVTADAFRLSATADSGGSVLLNWAGQTGGGTRVSYAIFRGSEDQIACVRAPHAAADCAFYSDALNHRIDLNAETRRTTYRDRPPAGHWVYRIAVRVLPTGDLGSGEFVTISRAATVDVG